MINTFAGNKVLLFGDIHGRTNWQTVPNLNSYDLIIFIGDYFDPYEPSLKKGMYDNFEKILNLKKSNPDKVLLLIGNHDLHYMYSNFSRCSRYSSTTDYKYGKKLRELRQSGLMQIAYMIENYMFVHAGVSMMWIRNTLMRVPDETVKYMYFSRREDAMKYPLTEEERNVLLEKVNEATPSMLEFDGGRDYDIYGTWPGQTPVWIRPSALIENTPEGIVQVIGHTQIKLPPQFIDERGTKIFLCDNGSYYTEIVDGEFIVREFKMPGK